MLDKRYQVKLVMARSLSLASSFFSFEPLLLFTETLLFFLLLLSTKGIGMIQLE